MSHVTIMSAADINAAIEEIAEDFDLLSDWEQRYAHVIEMGKTLAPLSEAEHTDANKVRGCASQVWMVTARDGNRLIFRGASDAHIVRGLIAVLLHIFSNRTPEDILGVEPKAVFARLGLGDALTPQRSNGLFSMMERIRRDARDALAAA